MLRLDHKLEDHINKQITLTSLKYHPYDQEELYISTLAALLADDFRKIRPKKFTYESFTELIKNILSKLPSIDHDAMTIYGHILDMS
jgi:hypothetical protein